MQMDINGKLLNEITISIRLVYTLFFNSSVFLLILTGDSSDYIYTYIIKYTINKFNSAISMQIFYSLRLREIESFLIEKT